MKWPISRVSTNSLAHLEEQIASSVATHCTEKMWLGAYRTTRQWEDNMWVDLKCDEESDEEEGGDDIDVAMEADEDGFEIADESNA